MIGLEDEVGEGKRKTRLPVTGRGASVKEKLAQGINAIGHVVLLGYPAV